MQRRFQVIRGRQDARRESADRKQVAFPIQFEDALINHLDSLFAFALHLVGGQRERAEDLLQTACLRAFRNYASLRSPEKLKPWFFQILVNTHINDFRRRGHEPLIADVELSDALLESASVVPAPTPEEQLFEQLLDSEVQEALDALPVEFRTVVWLADVEEMNYKEIAEIINCPPGTVASRLYRGHSLLRERLREYARRHGLAKE